MSFQLEFQEIIQSGEDCFHQFKESIGDSRKLAEEFVAFSNAEGGKIFIGVEDSGKIKGLSDTEIQDFNQLICGLGSGIQRALKFHPEIDFINDTNKEEFCSTIKRG